MHLKTGNSKVILAEMGIFQQGQEKFVVITLEEMFHLLTGIFSSVILSQPASENYLNVRKKMYGGLSSSR